jgi:hypothetical protein
MNLSPAAKESGHFYRPDGSPFYDVPNKSRPGELRPATVRDALAAGAEPSVSTVLKCAAAPGLDRWKIEQAVDSVLTLPRLPGETLDAFKARAMLDSQEQGRKARERGTALHGAIERDLQCLPSDPAFASHIRNVAGALQSEGIDIRAGHSERSFCLPGQFGGKVDWHSESVVLDFKGIEDSKIGGRLGYDEHIRQLAAYGHGLGLKSPRLLNVFIGRERGDVQLREWKPAEASKALAEFLALLRFYRLSKGFPVGATESQMTTTHRATSDDGQTETNLSEAAWAALLLWLRFVAKIAPRSNAKRRLGQLLRRRATEAKETTTGPRPSAEGTTETNLSRVGP